MGRGMLMTGRVYDYKAIREKYPEARLICIMRMYPRPIRSGEVEWNYHLGPSLDLLKKWKDGEIGEREYTFRYIMETSWTIRREHVMDLIQSMDEHQQDIILLCNEPAGEFCHRYILRDMIMHLCYYMQTVVVDMGEVKIDTDKDNE